MKKLYFLLLLITGMVNAQIVNIPDANFKAALITYGVDTNADGNIQVSEAQAVNVLVVSNSTITDLTGLENFTSLFSFDCSHNTITSLNVNGLSNLSDINCSYNQISSFTLMEKSYSDIQCDYNQLSSLNFGGDNLQISHFTATHNLLANTITLANKQFVEFNVSYNNLTSINMTNVVMNMLNCEYNQLTSLNLINFSIQQIWCPFNQLTSLDLSHAAAATSVEGVGNTFSFINLKNGFADSINCQGVFYICCDLTEGNLIYAPGGTVINSYCSFTPGGSFNAINGTVTFDSDNNGCDASDNIQSNIRLNINDGTNTGASFTNNLGGYVFYGPIGNFMVMPSVESPAWFNFSPPSVTIPFADSNNNVDTQNFCVTANGVHPDVEVIVAATIPARPGFDAEYKLVYRNKGNQAVTGNMSFEYNGEVLSFVTATAAPNNQSFGNLSWDYSNLLPFESRTITVTLHLNSSTDNPVVNVGDSLDFAATLNPFAGDENQTDNSFVYNQIVVGSYDPNDIICLQGHVVPPSEIGDYLYYVVNFENTGLADAENVVVRDVIDPAKFDLNSLQVIESSHPVTARITGNVAEFIFQTISLHSGGHGNILLKIRSKSTLSEGDMVSKNASIYFDYNAPISTNIENTVFQTLSNPNFETDDSVSVYPNPTKNNISIKANSSIHSIQLYDVQGRLLMTKLSDGNESVLDITAHNSGVYFVKIMTDNGMKVEQIIKQ